MNTMIYKTVHMLAIELLKSADEDNEAQFNDYYQQLQSLCDDNEAGEKNHPAQWEALADFTDDIDRALTIYQKALVYAEAIEAKDYMSTINYAMAMLLKERGETGQAMERINAAHASAKNIEDQELQREITALWKSLR